MSLILQACHKHKELKCDGGIFMHLYSFLVLKWVRICFRTCVQKECVRECIFFDIQNSERFMSAPIPPCVAQAPEQSRGSAMYFWEW